MLATLPPQAYRGTDNLCGRSTQLVSQRKPEPALLRRPLHSVKPMQRYSCRAVPSLFLSNGCVDRARAREAQR